MRYILRDKKDESERQITRKEALQLLKGNYRNPSYVLDNSDRLFNNLINLPFTEIRVVENCCIKNCEEEYGGWIDCSWHRRGKFQSGRLPFCKKHFRKAYDGIKEYEKRTCKKNQFLAFAPLDEITKILNS